MKAVGVCLLFAGLLLFCPIANALPGVPGSSATPVHSEAPQDRNGTNQANRSKIMGLDTTATAKAHESAATRAGALIEARSCERFALLAPRLPAPLGDFYAGLQAAEARHFELYLGLARAACAADVPDRWQARLRQLAAVEAELITAPDEQLRFHSGPPR